MRRQITRTLSLLLLAFVAPLSTARAALERVGPVVPAHGYPAWYQDETGLSLELCDNLTPAELQESWCLLLPGDVPGMPPLGAATRELFPDVFSNEHFYWAAHATFDVENDAQNRASLVLGLEAAFASGPVIPGDQMTFGRIRILVKSLPHSGTYTVYTPFGVYVFPDEVAGNKLFFTEDIGVNCALGTFHCALVSNLGPFLLPSPTPGGPEMPPVTPLNPTPDTNPAHFGGGVFIPTPYPGTGKKYIADPKRVGPVTGSPLPDFATSGGPRNPNIFRMEVRLATGQTIVVGETVDFSLMGRIFEGTIPGRITVEGASYANGVAASPTGAKLDVFATAFPTKQGRLPAAPETFPTPPLLQFYEGACAADPVTGAPSGPAAPGLPATQMVAEASRYWGQSSPLAVPPEVCLAQTNAINADGVLASVYYRATVADEVTVTEATYVPSVSLLVKATSSNVANPPTLTLTGFGDLVGGQYALPAPLSPLLPPPATVRVASTAGGLGELQVSTGLGTLSAPAVPVAGDDLVQIVEDTPAPAIDVLANDTFNGSPIGFDPATVAITIASAPRLGVATVNADGTLGYTPNLHSTGTDTIGYTVSVNGTASFVATVSVVIAGINDPPVAFDDATKSVIGYARVINVFANDVDPDGFQDMASVIIVTAPAPGAQVVAVGGEVTFTATATGTYTFSYQVMDAGGLVSNTATVTVDVPLEIVTIDNTDPAIAPVFVVAQMRWYVIGRNEPWEGQPVTIRYANGAYAGQEIAVVAAIADPAIAAHEQVTVGTWVFDVRDILPGTAVFDPRTARTFPLEQIFLVATGASGVQTLPVPLTIVE